MYFHTQSYAYRVTFCLREFNQRIIFDAQASRLKPRDTFVKANGKDNYNSDVTAVLKNDPSYLNFYVRSNSYIVLIR